MPFPILLLIVNLVGTLFLVGLIWTIQVVHYPLFSGVGDSQFIAYQKRHQFLVTLVVGPVMLLEAISSLLLVFYPPMGISSSMVQFGFLLVCVIWISTAAVQVPCHTRLLEGFSPNTHRWLVRSNWIRTVAWTVRGALLCWMLVEVLSVRL
ncbi:hypothetical protein [Roseimaritima multifibrata]|uniref:hypothetical protein n=1 Tax=Roseimaritima multifibrata TaxID=1930274 RepID=UPI0011A9BA1F|nr:hypothetical protein [Roseimaritima multifibrata]